MVVKYYLTKVLLGASVLLLCLLIPTVEVLQPADNESSREGLHLRNRWFQWKVTAYAHGGGESVIRVGRD